MFVEDILLSANILSKLYQRNVLNDTFLTLTLPRYFVWAFG